MANFPLPVKSVAYILYRGLIDQSNTKLLKASPTIASGDFKVSIDGGAFANLATLPTVTPAAGTSVKISLSSGEMAGDNIVVTCIDASGAEWCDQLINIQTATRGIDDLAYPATTGRSIVVDAAGLVDANTVKVGATGAGTAQTARDLGLALPAVAPGAANGLFIAGSNAPVTITGSGDALTLSSTGGNGNGLNASGNGSGEGIKGTGGATGNGIEGVGGATSGAGIKATASTNSAGIQADGAGTGDGMKLTGGATGNGLETIGGATSGDGFKNSVTSGAPIRGDQTGNLTGNVSGSVGSVGAGGIAAATFAAGAINAAAIATDAIDADALAADAITEIWNKAMTELASVPGPTGTVIQALEWVFAVARNLRTQTATTELLLKDDGTTTLGTSTKSDDSVTFTRGKYA